MKKDLLEQIKTEYGGDSDDLEEDIEEEMDLTKSVWIPVVQDPKQVIKDDPDISEMDLAAISEKEVFVRKANLVSIISRFYYLYRMISKKPWRIANLLFMFSFLNYMQSFWRNTVTPTKRVMLRN